MKRKWLLQYINGTYYSGIVKTHSVSEAEATRFTKEEALQQALSLHNVISVKETKSYTPGRICGDMRIVEEKHLADGSVIYTFEGVPDYVADVFAEMGKNVAIKRFATVLEEQILSKDDSAVPATFEIPSREECISIGMCQALTDVANGAIKNDREESNKAPAV